MDKIIDDFSELNDVIFAKEIGKEGESSLVITLHYV
jgi:hypothetical protein